MEIRGDAETSARTGEPTYTVMEKDRSVQWTLTRANLAEMAAWDAKSRSEQRAHLTTGSWSTWGPVADVDWYELHAVVARNSLRNFLNIGCPLDTAPALDHTND